MQIKSVFQHAVKHLRTAHIPNPELEASLLLAHVLGLDRTAVLFSGENPLSDQQEKQFNSCLARRLDHEPLAYIVGEKEFWSLSFKVSKDVLIPRPETEFLLEKALGVLRDLPTGNKRAFSILDLGTGSGVIGIVLARELPAAQITAVDFSYNALKVAEHNAIKLKVSDRINFINSCWFDAIAPAHEFDAVISNPPYISRDILAKPWGMAEDSLEPEVGCYEPHLALDGGREGIEQISRIAAELPGVLRPGGWFFMEMGADQEKAVLDIFHRTAAFGVMEVLKDYAGLPRVFMARRK